MNEPNYNHDFMKIDIIYDDQNITDYEYNNGIDQIIIIRPVSYYKYYLNYFTESFKNIIDSYMIPYDV